MALRRKADVKIKADVKVDAKPENVDDVECTDKQDEVRTSNESCYRYPI